MSAWLKARHWLRAWKNRFARTLVPPYRRRIALCVERLEDRLTPSTFLVTDTNDALNDLGSLRHALASANADSVAGDTATVVFDPSLAGQTITLGSLLVFSDTTPGVTVDIDGAAASGLTIAGNGGAFSLFSVDAGATAELANLTITQGTSGSDGGAVVNSGTLTIDDCTLTANTATGRGGAVFNTGTLTVDGSTLSDNTASTFGGAIENHHGTLLLQDSTITGNTAGSGGAIDNNRGTVTVTNSALTYDTASTGAGGGIENDAGTLTLQGTTLANDAASAGDGGGLFNMGTLTILSATMSDNTTAGDGGAMENFGGTATVANLTLGANQSTYDGGGISNDATLSLFDSTITSNAASGDGGGIANDGTLTLQNSIVSGNNAATGTDDVYGGINTDLGNNLLGTGAASKSAPASDIFTNSPGLAPLGSYGGALQTMPVLPNSPAHNAGNAAAANLPATDANGGARTVNGQLDVGAWQTQAKPFYVTTTADPGGVAGATSLREAVTLANLWAANGASAAITFAPSLAGATITLTGGHLELSGAPASGQAVISIAGQPGLTLDGGGNDTVLVIDSGVTAAVSNLIIADGAGSGMGGGIENDGTLTITSCTLTGNNASSANGGGIDSPGTLTVQDCTFTNNSADGTGGGLEADGALTISDCTFTGNSASSGGGINATVALAISGSAFNGNTTTSGVGAAITAALASTVTGCTFTNNNAAGNGGAVYGYDSLTIDQSTFAGNYATGYGGAIDGVGAVTITDSTFSKNTASGNGGAVAGSAAVTVQDSTFSGDTAGGSGGGIYGGGTVSFSGGSVTGETATGNGGAIASAASVTVQDSTISGNSASGNGGGLYAAGAVYINGDVLTNDAAASGYGGAIDGATTVTVTNSSFAADSAGSGGAIDSGSDLSITNGTFTGNNTASGDGGAVSCGGNLSLVDATFDGNTAAGNGGATTDTGATVTVQDSTFNGNTAAGNGGAINGGNTVTITNATFTGNSATAGNGGAVAPAGDLNLLSCTFFTNSASGNGGAVIGSGNLTIQDTSFGTNSATGDGGAIEDDGTLTMQGCSLGGNSAYDGAAINNTGTATVFDSTLCYNAASDQGGGIAGSGTLTVQNTIVAANTAVNGSPDVVGSIGTDLGNNVLGTAVYAGATPLPSDVITNAPGVAPLGNYGGGMPTMPLLPGSLAIGKGNAAAAGLSATDEAGDSRTTVGKLDIGAFQTHANPMQVNSASDAGDAVGQVTLRDAVNLANVYAHAGLAATITFAPTLQGTTIELAQGPLVLSGVPTKGHALITITAGPSVTLSGGGTSSVFDIDTGVTALLSGFTITGGNATSGGGILNDGTLTLRGCTLEGNAASGNGGAITNSGTLSVSDSTLAGNAASGNGGAIMNSGTLSVVSSTISANAASGAGGGIASTNRLLLQNTILAGNAASGSADLSGKITTDLGNNLLGTTVYPGKAPAHDVATDTPGLAPLGDYGGALETMALLPTSRALGAGSVSASGLPTTDARGFARTVNGRIDIGAFQTQASPFVVTTAADPGRLAGLLSLREAVNLANVYAGAGRAATITFGARLTGATITLSQGALQLSGVPLFGSATITISGGRAITLNGNGASAVFQVDAGVSAVLSGMGITHGSDSGIVNHGFLTVLNSTLSGNAASGAGGALANTGTLTVVDSTLSGNAASDGGAIESSGSLTLQACTISGNAASGEGGGIANTGTLSVQNTIVAANTAGMSNPDILGAITTDLGNNLLGTAVAGTQPTDRITDTPGLAPLGTYGGYLLTMALLPGSLALGGGSAHGAPTTDERGKARRLSAGKSIVDIGAFGSAGFTLTIAAGSATQTTRLGQPFPHALVVLVKANNASEPVNGGVVTFTVRASSQGAGATLSSYTLPIANGFVQASALANSTVGTYMVVATTTGAVSSVFHLSND